MTASGKSRRYIRLTYLIPELLSMVDEGKIAFNPAVEISYLDKAEQRVLLKRNGTERLHTVPRTKHTTEKTLTGWRAERPK